MLSTSDFNVKIDGYIDLSAIFSNIDLAPANTLENETILDDKCAIAQGEEDSREVWVFKRNNKA